MAVAAFCLVIAACGGDKKNGNNSEASTSEVPSSAQVEATEETPSHLALLKPENISLPSELKGKVEVVPEDDGYIYVDFDDNYPKLSLTLKLIEKVPVPDKQRWLVGHAQDEKGRNIEDLNPKDITSREWRSEDSDGNMVKDFLTGEVGETITLNYTGESNVDLFEKDDSKIKEGKEITKKAAEKFAKFKLSFSD